MGNARRQREFYWRQKKLRENLTHQGSAPPQDSVTIVPQEVPVALDEEREERPRQSKDVIEPREVPPEGLLSESSSPLSLELPRCDFCGQRCGGSRKGKESADMKKIHKRVLVTRRRRRPPATGWSWIDRRFLPEYAPRLERDAVLLYFFLVAVSDKDGLSYWGDTAVAANLRMAQGEVARAREELLSRDLIAYEEPLYQVLSLSEKVSPRRGDVGPEFLGDIMREIASRTDSHHATAERRP